MALVVTAPHSVCFPQLQYRHCDTVAYLASSRLVKLCSQDTYTKYFPSDTPRWVTDLNRPIAANTKYRQQVRNALNEAKLLIDVHSAPRGVYGTDADLVILDNEPETWYGHTLFDIVKHNSISVAYRLGAKYNDITEEARRHGVPAILLEYGEFLDTPAIDQINQSICEWVRFMLSR